ncbi:MAG TPA: Hsp70 family protein [Candidatus Methylomirabilis sp.]|nr:Hsp70 family protein [Candidatus Methylomirabilis sp.]
MTAARFLIGIDLGTSNCAVAAAEPRAGRGVTDIPILQLQRPGDVTPRPLLPSCIYLPGQHELPPEAIRLPWESGPDCVVGEFARWQGARVPGRLVVSAKSWLCHPGVDREAPILPWGAALDVRRISPVEASARLLGHMVRSWDAGHPEAPLADQEVVITVPASFDEVARTLTVAAARRAGLERFTLVEEPQAAFYDFIARHRRDLARVLEGVRLVLVVDVGGGTTDFTLVRVGASPDGPALTRLAVGDHLLLGGDNMDAALGRRAEERMLSGGRKLGPGEWSQLVQASRLAKEALLREDGPEQYRLSVAGEGSRLVGRSLSAQLSRAEAEEVIHDGFFPGCRPDEAPQRGPRVALLELGLPYAQDPAITRQLAAFLRVHAEAGSAALGETGSGSGSSQGLPRPDAILLNGGVFNSKQLAARLVEVVSGWWPEAPPIRVLAHDSLELAVARGAACYGLIRRGLGRRIGGGAARALYVGLEKKGAEQPAALCVIPRGHEEGETVDLGGRTFHLSLGRPVQFPLFATTSDRVEAAGAIVPVGEELHPLPPIHTLLGSADAKTGTVPVHLRATLTAIGTLELWCVSEASDERWRLEFELRGGGASGAAIESMPPGFAEASSAIQQIFGRTASPPRQGMPKGVRHLWKSLEQALGPRDQWRVPVLRELWDLLFARAARRRRSADHERLCYQLLGYTLRPGFGYPLDDWRSQQTARLFGEGVQYHKEKPVWIEFWVMWRRIAGGLSEAHHREIWTYLKPHLVQRLSPAKPAQAARPKGIQPEGLDEMVRLAAALEHLPPAEKVELGDWISARLSDPATAGGPWAWALGRLGARVPLYGSVHKTVGPEKAAEWLALLLEAQGRGVEGALFAVVQLARRSGDRARDLDEALCAQAMAALQAADASPSWRRLLRDVAPMETADEARALGDTLPVGLQVA